MDRGALPGFYYDKEKNKYFKIQSANASRDLDLRYSAENIRKRERVERIQVAAAARVSKTRKERVVRRHGINLTNACMEREIGMKRTSAYVHGLWPDACTSAFRMLPYIFFEKSRGGMGHFDVDPVSGTVWAAHDRVVFQHGPESDHAQQEAQSDTSSTTHASLEDAPNPGAHGSGSRESEPSGAAPSSNEETDSVHGLEVLTSDVSSLNFLPGTGVTAITSYGSDKSALVLFRLVTGLGSHMCQHFAFKDKTIWDAAPLHESLKRSTSDSSTTTDQLAVVMDDSLLMFTSGSEWNFRTCFEKVGSNLLSVDWLDYNTVAMGCRNGKVILYDNRSNGSSHILTHPQPVIKIKRADDPTRIICAGLNNTLYLYDIRMARQCSTRQQASTSRATTSHYNGSYFSDLETNSPRRTKKRQKLDRVNATKWSEPILTFQHSNIDVTTLDIAVHSRLGLLAAAQDEQTDVAIRVYNIWTGNVVREFKRPEAPRGEKRESWPIRRLRWVDRVETGALELWSGWEGDIGRFKW